MITVIVNFDLPKETTIEQAAEKFRGTAPKYRTVDGLVRKNYLFNKELQIGGGAYIFESRAQAEALFTPEWIATLTERYGAPPKITYFESPVVVDNVAGEIIS